MDERIEGWTAELRPLLGAGPQHKERRQYLRRQINAAQQQQQDLQQKSTKKRYPSTPHLPFSPQVNSDDVQLQDSQCLPFFPQGLNQKGVDVVITEKLDGGNCCLREGKVYARTHSKEADHASFGPIKQMYSEMLYEPEIAALLMPSRQRWRQWRGITHGRLSLFGENMFGVHSIEYDGLGSFFYLFGVFDNDRQEWWPWDAVVALAHFLGVPTTPVLLRGTFSSLQHVRRWMEARAVGASAVSAHAVEEGAGAGAGAGAGEGAGTAGAAVTATGRVRAAPGGVVRPEGFVLRVAQGFTDEVFTRSMAKYVRAGHNQTAKSWSRTWRKAVLHPAAVTAVAAEARLQQQHQQQRQDDYERQEEQEQEEKMEGGEATQPPPPPPASLVRQLSDDAKLLLRSI